MKTNSAYIPTGASVARVNEYEKSDVNGIFYLYEKKFEKQFFFLRAEIFTIDESGLSLFQNNQSKVFAQIGAFLSIGRG
jgi:hypothetical protein